MSQIARGCYKAAVTGGQIPEPSRIGSRELLARRLRLADQILHSETYFEETYLLFIVVFMKGRLINSTSQAVRSNEYDRTGRYD